jgi:DNA-binding Lrp family transcriptional regulator
MRRCMNERIEAYVLLTVEIDKVEKALAEIKKKVKNVKEANAVTGPYDAILRVEASNLRELTRVILPKIFTIEGVIDTTTAIVIPKE